MEYDSKPEASLIEEVVSMPSKIRTRNGRNIIFSYNKMRDLHYKRPTSSFLRYSLR